jgi:hypothetical protein
LYATVIPQYRRGRRIWRRGGRRGRRRRRKAQASPT